MKWEYDSWTKCYNKIKKEQQQKIKVINLSVSLVVANSFRGLAEGFVLFRYRVSGISFR